MQQGRQVRGIEVIVRGGNGEHLENIHANVCEVIRLAKPCIVGGADHAGISDEQGIVEKALVLAVFGPRHHGGKLRWHPRHLRLLRFVGFFRFSGLLRLGRLFRFSGLLRLLWLILTTLLGLLHAAEVRVVMQQHEWHGDGQTVLPAPYILLQLGLQHKARYGGCQGGGHQQDGQHGQSSLFWF